jgi:hypothetical protein
MVSPSMLTEPPDGRSSPASSARSVDLPLPDGPITATNSPRAIETDTSSRTVIVFGPERNRRMRPRVWIIGRGSLVPVASSSSSFICPSTRAIIAYVTPAVVFRASRWASDCSGGDCARPDSDVWR